MQLLELVFTKYFYYRAFLPSRLNELITAGNLYFNVLSIVFVLEMVGRRDRWGVVDL